MCLVFLCKITRTFDLILFQKVSCTCCGLILSLVHISISCFKLIIIQYSTQKQKKIKFEPRLKVNHNIPIISLLMADLHQKKDPTDSDYLSLDSSWFLLPPQEAKTCALVRVRTFQLRNCLHNFWEVCTFWLVLIFTPEDMFANGKEMGKGCGAVHSISDFLFWFWAAQSRCGVNHCHRTEGHMETRVTKWIVFVCSRLPTLDW